MKNRMATKLKHVSIGVDDPKKAAEAVAELTEGKASPFHPVENGWVCLWNGWDGEFIEFYPSGTHLVLTEHGAEFQGFKEERKTCATHINLSVACTGKDVQEIAKRYGYTSYFRPSDGGPLWEVWLDNSVLIELVTSDL